MKMAYPFGKNKWLEITIVAIASSWLEITIVAIASSWFAIKIFVVGICTIISIKMAWRFQLLRLKSSWFAIKIFVVCDKNLRGFQLLRLKLLRLKLLRLLLRDLLLNFSWLAIVAIKIAWRFQLLRSGDSNCCD